MDTVHSGTQERYVERAKSRGESFAFSKVKTVSLTNLLLSIQTPSVIHFLSLDIEGSEMAALESLDFTIFKPVCIASEVKFRSLASLFDDPIVDFLRAQGYRAISKTPLDVIFVDPKSRFLNWIPKEIY